MTGDLERSGNKCDAPWDDPEHLRLPVAYVAQTPQRQRNGALPLFLCARCLAEQRAAGWQFLWMRSL